ncbi:hypothetical protein HGB07_06465 [Candidatus Roizmanbacteria bacterium]|nr:hypothetical protein [Candidatus Roizmanbacteria bacterium]
MPNKQRLGDILIEKEILSKDILDQALRAQVGGNRRLGHILVRMKAITADQLAETLSEQLGIPICNIGDKFSPKVKKILPRYLCRQYDVLPLAEKNNNILELAMANPADVEAIYDLENYTGKVIEPLLARHSEIEQEITRRISKGWKDYFSPQANTRITRIAVACCLALVIVLGGFTYRFYQTATYGTVTVSTESTLYKNHDLMLDFDKTGKITLLGRGAFAKGFYSVSFNDKEALHAFLRSKQSDLSGKQQIWTDWVLAKQSVAPTAALAVSK